MNKKCVFAAVLAACMMVQPCMSSFAAEFNESLGPGAPGAQQYTEAAGSGGPGAVMNAWTKVGGAYIDDQGNRIDGAILRGVSVSKWQGDVNWGKVAAEDISFALVRMGSFGYEGEYTMDPYYDKNMPGCARFLRDAIHSWVK